EQQSPIRLQQNLQAKRPHPVDAQAAVTHNRSRPALPHAARHSDTAVAVVRIRVPVITPGYLGSRTQRTAAAHRCRSGTRGDRRRERECEEESEEGRPPPIRNESTHVSFPCSLDHWAAPQPIRKRDLNRRYPRTLGDGIRVTPAFERPTARVQQ